MVHLLLRLEIMQTNQNMRIYIYSAVMDMEEESHQIDSVHGLHEKTIRR